MNNVYIIGDTYTTTIFEYHNFNNPIVNLKVWGAGGGNILNFDALGYKSDNTISSEFEKIKFPKPISFTDINDDGLLLSWFGYIDVKHYLPKYPEHIDKIVIKYIKNLKENFPNSKIKIIEPHPQFELTMIKESEDLDLYDYETRKIYNKKLCESLRKHSLELGLGETITQDQIYQSTGLNEFTMNHIEKNTDRLLYKYRVSIYNMLMQEIYGILGIN
jgi:hypothetical protein